MAKIKGWTKIREDTWKNKSGLIVQIWDMNKVSSNYKGYVFGYFGPNNKINGINGGFANTYKSAVRKKAIEWLKKTEWINNPYINN